MRKRSPLRKPRIPLGCDQQGRFPEAIPRPAEACTEVGQEDESEPPWKLTDLAVVITAITLLALVLTFV